MKTEDQDPTHGQTIPGKWLLQRDRPGQNATRSECHQLQELAPVPLPQQQHSPRKQNTDYTSEFVFSDIRRRRKKKGRQRRKRRRKKRERKESEKEEEEE